MPFSSPRTKLLVVLLAISIVIAAAAVIVIASNRSGGTRAADDQGTGDSLFPHIGTSAYDVRHYAIELTYADDGSIRARTTITARTPHPLESFALDFVGLEVDDVIVDGEPAESGTAKEKLTITPESPVEGTFKAVVDYHGTPKTYEDPDGSSEGWIPTDRGVTVMSQPIGAMSWFPNNNTPTDKATFDIALTVPDDLEAASNGVLAGKRPGKGGTTWDWEQPEPMAPYLAMISIGEYEVFESSMTLDDGRKLPIWSFIDPSFGPLEKKRALLEESIRLGERLYGPYPAASAGIVVENVGVDYALETQDRAVYDGDPDDLTIMHETAHQWVGNSVGLEDWGDIWINEGFATHAEWSWTAEHGGVGLTESFIETYETHDENDEFWKLPPADLGSAENLFSDPTYYRGAMTLEELRQRIGDDNFAELRIAWPSRNEGRTATTEDFIALAEKISGDDLGGFFETWLYQPGRPTLEN